MNVHCGYRELRPPTELVGHVACVWIETTDSHGARFSDRVLPDGCTDLMWSPQVGGWFRGPDTEHFPIGPRPRTVVVGVKLRPGVAATLIHAAPGELLNSRAPLVTVWRDDPGGLLAALERMRTAQGAIDALLHAVGRAVERVRVDPVAAAVAARLAWDPSSPTVTRLVADAGVGERQLERRCHAAFGYGPKTLERILRVQRFLELADKHRCRGLAELGALAGYADQSHLGRECRRLTGLTPAAARGRLRSAGDVGSVPDVQSCGRPR